MLIKDSLYFYYDDIFSKNMGIENVNLSRGLQKEFFMGDKRIIEQSVRGRDKPYLIGVERDPISVPLNFMFKDRFDYEKISKVVRWLNQDYYKKLYFCNDIFAPPKRIFFAMYQGSVDILHNCLQSGYIEIEMRCDSFCAYSKLYTTEEYDFSSNDEYGSLVSINNKGDTILKPNVQIEKVGAGNVSIVNESNNDLEFAFVDLQNGDIIQIDNENEYIHVVDPPDTYRYDNFNNVFLEIVLDQNDLRIYGDCKVQFEYRYKYLK